MRVSRRGPVFVWIVLSLCISVSAAESKSIQETEVTTKGGNSYTLKSPYAYEDPLTPYGSLSAEDQRRFQENREKLLALVANSLEKVIPPEKTEKSLKTFDGILWNQAGLIAKANEIGVSGEVGGDIGAKVGKYGFHGVTGIGLIVAYDRDRRALVIELYQDLDRTKVAIPFYAGGGGFGSVLLSVSHSNPNEPLRVEKGSGFSAYGEIGPFSCGVAGCVTDRNLRVGFSTGVGAGWPPAALLTNEVQRVPYARVAFSPSFPYVHPKVLGAEQAKRAATTVVTKPLELLSSVIQSCSDALGSLRKRGDL